MMTMMMMMMMMMTTTADYWQPSPSSLRTITTKQNHMYVSANAK